MGAYFWQDDISMIDRSLRYKVTYCLMPHCDQLRMCLTELRVMSPVCHVMKSEVVVGFFLEGVICVRGHLMATASKRPPLVQEEVVNMRTSDTYMYTDNTTPHHE